MVKQTPSVNPNVNHGFWTILTCQRRFPDCSRCASPVRGVESGGGCSCMEAGGGYIGTPHFQLSFAVNWKLLWKVKSTKICRVIEKMPVLLR